MISEEELLFMYREELKDVILSYVDILELQRLLDERKEHYEARMHTLAEKLK